jgi:hypothetical protein
MSTIPLKEACASGRSEGVMPRRSLLTFEEPDGRIRVEMLGSSDDFADLVDPHDGAIRHSEPFAMHGAEWTIESVTVTEQLTRIRCVSTAEARPRAPRRRSSRLGFSRG